MRHSEKNSNFNLFRSFLGGVTGLIEIFTNPMINPIHFGAERMQNSTRPINWGAGRVENPKRTVHLGARRIKIRIRPVHLGAASLSLHS